MLMASIDQIQAALTSLNLAKHRLEKERILLGTNKENGHGYFRFGSQSNRHQTRRTLWIHTYQNFSQDAVWAVLDRANRSVTVREVIETLNSGGIDMEQRYSSPYNSVYTALKRLVGKGKVEEDLLPDGDKRYHVARNFVLG